jgi:hypothetical protein
VPIAATSILTGIDDPLELLKLVHSPPKPDPLIRYAPPPRQPAALYAELGSGQIAALVRHAHSLLKKGDTHRAQDIAACIVAFVCADISSLLQELIRIKSCDRIRVPPRCAEDSQSADSASARVAGHDRLLTDKLLSALAWVGDERVVDLFAGWRAEPPGWASDLHIPAPVCARGGLGAVARRPATKSVSRDLLSLLRGDAATTDSSDRLTDTNLFEIDGTSEALAFLGCRQQIVVPIGDPTLVGDLPRRSLVRASATRSPWHAAMDSLPTQYSQIGGHPTWVQDSEYPTCGSCARTMPFIGQISCEDIEPNREGIFYAFLCPDCVMTASTYQQT